MRGAQGLVRTPIYFLTQLLFIPCLNNIRPSCPVLSHPEIPDPLCHPVVLRLSRYNGVTAEFAGLLFKHRVLSHPFQPSVLFTPQLSLQLYRRPSNLTSLPQSTSKKTKHPPPPKRPKKTDWDDVRPKKTYGWNLKLFSGEGQSKNSNRWFHWNQSSAGHHEKKELNKQFNLLLNRFFYEFACS